MHVNGTLDLKETKRIKDRINNIKDDILEGVRIRARVKEQVEGEVASSSLLGKQSTNKNKPYISEIKTEHASGDFEIDTILNNQINISKYVTSYYTNLYSKSITDKKCQDWFLSFIDKSISDSDNNELVREISDDEILLTMKAFSTNKSPGIDGIPIEFYLKFFNIIKNEFCEVVRNSLRMESLTESQRKAIIILIFKGGDCKLISSWRPISLICVDTKILAKLIAHRIRLVLNKCISQEQYCGKD